jgi:fatty acid desaturase
VFSPLLRPPIGVVRAGIPFAIQADMAPLARHFLRIAVSVALLVAARASLPLAALAACLVFFAAFALLHDLMHSAIALPRWASRVTLAAAGLLLFTSGHATRATHLYHHARPLADDDLEGLGARLPLLRAVAFGPWNFVAIRARGLALTRRVARRWAVGETVLAIAAFTGAALSAARPLVVYALVALALSTTMSAWAAHLPHRAPAWLLRVARALAFTRSPVVLSLAFHAHHHAEPRVPCEALRDRL